MVAIHFEKGNNYSERWKSYCEEKNIPYKIVSCYENNIIDQLEDCKALFWHVNNLDFRDQLLAKNLILALGNTPIKVYPDQHTVWHFDDKVAQKYLFESIGAPLVPSYVFYDKQKALRFIDITSYPKVFKLSKGGAAVNVVLVKSKRQGRQLVKKAFGKGFPVLDMKSVLRDRYRKFRLGKESFLGLLKGVARLYLGTPFTQMSSNEKGYIYFQEFIPDNKFDVRVITVGNRAFAHKRMVRKNDFRASGSGQAFFDKESIDIEAIRIAFESSQKLKLQSAAYDFVYNKDGQLKIVEVSYAFSPAPNRHHHPGYWDPDLKWHAKDVVFEDWMIEDLLQLEK